MSCIPSSSNSLADCTTHPIHCNSRMPQRHDSNLLFCAIMLKNTSVPFVLRNEINFAAKSWLWRFFQGNIKIKRIYYVTGLNHNISSVGQFCDADLEVAFQKSTVLLEIHQGNTYYPTRRTDLYTIFTQETTSLTPHLSHG
ncbi:hypothetical protein Tco_0247181 [Tanacetum coccineum]|uniref:Uncharacterized protein n=1 Tax=Tanacetum coccineum TaxID=301880 RepID=A0ABQ5A453_9ASTR